MATSSSSSSTNEKRVERTFNRLLPPHVTSAAEAYQEWLNYAWIGGADLPLAGKPIILERGAFLLVWLGSGWDEKSHSGNSLKSLPHFLCSCQTIKTQTGDLQSGDGLLRRIPPIGIEEKIVAASYPKLVEYKVMNPGWTTFQVHDHKGEVRFEEVEGEGEGGKRVRISWLLSIRPWFGFGRKYPFLPCVLLTARV